MSTDEYIGRRISLITKREFRYEGTLAGINAEEQKLSLTRVRFYGSEDRDPVTRVAGTDGEYAEMIFSAADIKELNVLPPETPLPPDPAIVSASTFTPGAPKPVVRPSAAAGQGGVSASGPQPVSRVYSSGPARGGPAMVPANTRRWENPPSAGAAGGRPSYGAVAAGAAAGGARPATRGGHRDGGRDGGHREGGHHHREHREHHEGSRPTGRAGTGEALLGVRAFHRSGDNPHAGLVEEGKKLKLTDDFDLAAANAKFNKDEELRKLAGGAGADAAEEDGGVVLSKPVVAKPAYDKSSSFFDSLSSSYAGGAGSLAAERKANMETFGASGLDTRNFRRGGRGGGRGGGSGGGGGGRRY